VTWSKLFFSYETFTAASLKSWDLRETKGDRRKFLYMGWERRAEANCNHSFSNQTKRRVRFKCFEIKL
jgi:hypothetical protein